MDSKNESHTHTHANTYTQAFVDMGFSRTHAEQALRHVGSNRVDAATEWLLTHPEEQPGPAAGAGAAAPGECMCGWVGVGIFKCVK